MKEWGRGWGDEGVGREVWGGGMKEWGGRCGVGG